MAAIECTNNVLGGKPRISGTRMSVDVIGSYIASGYGIKEIREAYPHLNDDQISAALAYFEDRSRTERGKIEPKKSKV